MDIQQVNSVLSRAIMEFQEDELGGLVEAMAMSPEDYGWMNPGVSVSGERAKALERTREFPQGLVQRLLQMKRDLPGVSVKQRRVGRRTTDLEIRLRGGVTIPVTVERHLVSLGGGRGMVRTGGRSVSDVYSDVLKFVRRHGGRARVSEALARGRTSYRVPMPGRAVRVEKITVARVKQALKRERFSLDYRDHSWFSRSVDVTPGVSFVEKKFNGRPVRYEYIASAYSPGGSHSTGRVSLKDAVAWTNERAQAAADAVAAETGRTF